MTTVAVATQVSAERLAELRTSLDNARKDQVTLLEMGRGLPSSEEYLAYLADQISGIDELLVSRAEIARLRAESPRWKFYWLIEKRGLPAAMWLKADGQWTMNAHEALWFIRKEDAETHRIAYGHDFVRIVVCDHAFAIDAALKEAP